MGCYKRSVLGQEDHKHKGAALRLLGDAVIQFDNCALRYNSTRNELASSCKIYASDLIVEGSRITVAQILDLDVQRDEIAVLRDEMAALKRFVGMIPPPPSLPPTPPRSPFYSSAFTALRAAINSTSALLMAGSIQQNVCSYPGSGSVSCTQHQVSTSQHWSDSTPNFYIMVSGYASDDFGDLTYQYGYMSNTDFETLAQYFTVAIHDGSQVYSQLGIPMHPQPYVNNCTDFVAKNEDVHRTEPWLSTIQNYHPTYVAAPQYFATLDAAHTDMSVVAVAGSFCP